MKEKSKVKTEMGSQTEKRAAALNEVGAESNVMTDKKIETDKKAGAENKVMADKKVKPEKKAKPDRPVKYSKIGGQALLEGVMMRGERSMAMAVRDPDGDILVETERLGEKKWYNKAPIIRGVTAFVSSLVVGMKTLMRSAEISGDEEEKLSKGAMGFAVVLGIALAVVLFFLLPELTAWVFYHYIYRNVLVKSLISGVMKVAIFLIYLLSVSRIKDIRRTFMYHGAEHRTINCYEHDKELNVKNVQSCSTRHARCGTTFLFLVIVVSIIIYAVVNYFLAKYVPIKNSVGEMAVWGGIKLLLLPLIAGVSYEFLRLFAMIPDNLFGRIVRAPGLALQRLTTYPPEDDMAEVAIKAFNAVMEMDDNPEIQPHKFDEVDVREAYAVLEPLDKNEAAWLLSEVTGIGLSDLYCIKKLSLKDFKKLKQAVAQRLGGKPFDYVVGNSVFYGIKLKVNPDVLIPRNETELLVEKALEFIGDKSLRVADVCTGSGCIARAICENSSCEVIATDISDEAIKVASQNLEGKAEVIKSDLLTQTEGQFDLIVSNPPYVATSVIDTLDQEVTCQPRIALDGGEDGLDVIRRLVREGYERLNVNGALIMEIGYDQGGAAAGLMTFAGYRNIKIIKDYGGNDRIAYGEK